MSFDGALTLLGFFFYSTVNPPLHTPLCTQFPLKSSTEVFHERKLLCQQFVEYHQDVKQQLKFALSLFVFFFL